MNLLIRRLVINSLRVDYNTYTVLRDAKCGDLLLNARHLNRNRRHYRIEE